MTPIAPLVEILDMTDAKFEGVGSNIGLSLNEHCFSQHQLLLFDVNHRFNEFIAGHISYPDKRNVIRNDYPGGQLDIQHFAGMGLICLGLMAVYGRLLTLFTT
jgi:hypothetical protein